MWKQFNINEDLTKNGRTSLVEDPSATSTSLNMTSHGGDQMVILEPPYKKIDTNKITSQVFTGVLEHQWLWTTNTESSFMIIF